MDLLRVPTKWRRSKPVEHNELMMKKQALCLQCMKCCKIIAFPTLYPNSPTVKNLYKERGWEVYWDSKREILFIYGNHPCLHLGKNGCTIYGKRPKACRDYDGRNDGILKDECLWNTLAKPSNFDVSE